MGHHFLANRSSRTHDGEVSEWFKEPVLKTGDSERGRGFESHLLRFELQLDTSEYRFWIQLEKYPSG